jgi:hypothetical protein
LVFSGVLGGGIHVLAINNTRIVSVNDKVDLVFLNDIVQILSVHNVRAARYDFVHKLARTDHGKTFVIVHERSALALSDRII